MRFEDEKYVRIFTRDTTNWKMLSWYAQTLLLHLSRKVDRAGVLELGTHGLRGITAHLEKLPQEDWPKYEQALRDELIGGSDPPLAYRGGCLVWKKFIEGQECKMSDAARQRMSREKARDLRLHGHLIDDGGEATQVQAPESPSQGAVFFFQEHPDYLVAIDYADSIDGFVASLGIDLTHCDEKSGFYSLQGNAQTAQEIRAKFAVHANDLEGGVWFEPAREILNYMNSLSRRVTPGHEAQPTPQSTQSVTSQDVTESSRNPSVGHSVLSVPSVPSGSEKYNARARVGGEPLSTQWLEQVWCTQAGLPPPEPQNADLVRNELVRTAGWLTSQGETITPEALALPLFEAFKRWASSCNIPPAKSYAAFLRNLSHVVREYQKRKKKPKLQAVPSTTNGNGHKRRYADEEEPLPELTPEGQKYLAELGIPIPEKPPEGSA